MTSEKKRLEGIVKTNCGLCNLVTPHRYVGKVDAGKIYYLYKCLYCGHKYQSEDRLKPEIPGKPGKK